MERYTPINLPEMAELLKTEKGWVCISPYGNVESYFDFKLNMLSNFKTDVVEDISKGAIERIRGTSVFIRVYSSIVGQQSREVGKDAIRVCIIAEVPTKEYKRVVGIQSFTRVHRTANWRDNLRKRVQEAFDWAVNNVRSCKLCGQLLVVRCNKRGIQFFGCSGYPTCKHTEPYRAKEV
jgi:hypothetical protein